MVTKNLANLSQHSSYGSGNLCMNSVAIHVKKNVNSIPQIPNNLMGGSPH